MKGIILAAGNGTRLGPVTGGIGWVGIGVSKALVPACDKPTIYYPLSDLISAGIKEILIIAAPGHVYQFRRLIGNGRNLGIKITYMIQPKPVGIANAFIIAEKFIGDDDVALIFGDNIFSGERFNSTLKAYTKPRGATVFAYHVPNPQDYGVVEFDKNMRAVSIEEKPALPKSNYAVVGIYFYTPRVIEIAKTIKPSARGELEITDVNEVFLKQSLLDVTILDTDTAWFDTGTPDSLGDASEHVRQWQSRTGHLLGSPEAAAFNAGFIDKDRLLVLAEAHSKTKYGKSLTRLATTGWK